MTTPVQESVPVVSSSTSLPSQSSTEPRPLMGALRWFVPRSQNRDERFRERAVRALVALTVVIMSLLLLVTVLFIRDSWAVISFPSINLYLVFAFIFAGFLVSRGKLDAASWVLVLAMLIGASMLHRLAIQDGNPSRYVTGLSMLMITPLGAAMLLRRTAILPAALAAVVSFVVIEFLLPRLASTPFTLDATLAIPLAMTILLGEGAILFQLRSEFDSRFEALDEAIRQEAMAREQAEAARKRAEEADKAKSQFLANMSHELRTPLNAIIGYSDILVGGMVGELPPQPVRLMSNIQSNSRRLLSLINDVLDLSKIEAGRIEVFNAPLQPRRLITDTVESLRALAIEKSIYLNITISEDVPEVILSDGRKIAQILTNLVSNAVKFTSKGGVDVDVTADSAQWHIVVRDTGSGIPEQALAYIFEPFRQADSTDARSHKGTGLGLAIVKALAESLNGEIEVKSIPTQGSTFRVSLPRALPTELGSVAPAANTSAAM